MPGRIPEQVIADIRERTDIVQVIGQHVQLKRAGANHKGLCPFHDEKTPSFNVNPQRQFYHCFGCQASGDVFSFLMKLEGRSFTEVVEDLAMRAGVEVPRERQSPREAQAAAKRRSERQRGLDLNAQVAKLYRERLLADPDGPGQRYLAQRGIGSEVAALFQLGHAPGSGDVVVRALAREPSTLEFAERLGLVARRSGRGGHHDRFWNRLIFPVIGAAGEILGFGGRMLGDGNGPKYINTPETFMYRKGEVLFGLQAAAKPMRTHGTALVVEGNFDVIQLHQHGFDGAVAPMGTALTERQVLLLKRFARRVVAIFDGDDAGQAAALKAVPQLVAGGLEARVATLPSGHDPDSLLRERGRGAMQQLIDVAQPAVDFLIETLRARMDDSIPGRARLLERVAKVLGTIPSPAERDLYIGRLAVDLGIDPVMVRRAVGGGKLATGPGERPARARQRRAEQPSQPIFKGEFDSLSILVEHPHLVPRAEAADLSSLLTNEGLRATYRAAVRLQQETGQIDPVKLIETTPPELRDTLASAVMSGAFATVGDPTRALDDCVNTLRRRRLERRRQDLKNEMARARSSGDAQHERTLASQMLEVEREIHETR